MPATANSLNGLVINEIGYDPTGAPGFDTDLDSSVEGNDDEFIEFINTSGSALDLTGYQVWDGSSGQLVYTFGSVSLAAGQRFVLMGESTSTTAFLTANPGVLADVADNTNFNLNNIAEQLAVVDPATGDYITFAYAEPGNPPPTGIELSAGFTGTNLIHAEAVTLSSVADGQTIQRFPDGDTNWIVGNSAAGSANCFLRGTMIATPQGEVAIEDLCAGDEVLDRDGTSHEIIWVPRQTVMPRFRLADRLRPVLIEKDSFGPDLPRRDLCLTADHALVLQGCLVHAGALVDGVQIRVLGHEELPTRLDYFHIETERHVVLVANGLPAESFVDNVPRSSFDNYDEYVSLFGETAREMDELPMPRAMSARQVPERVKVRLTSAA
jgi:hypothetical protein